jgi:hypothetical protein
MGSFDVSLKGRASAKTIEKDFPYIVEMQVPLGGFGRRLDVMYEWFSQHGIKPINSTGRRDENNRDHIRWCVADGEIAKKFASEFPGCDNA